MIYNTDITLEINSNVSNTIIYAHQGDKNSRFITAKVTCNNEFVSLDGLTAKVDAVVNNLVVAKDVECSVSSDNNTIIIPLTESMLSVAGVIHIDLKIFDSEDAIVTTQTFNVNNSKSVINSDSRFTPVNSSIGDTIIEVDNAKKGFSSLDERLDKIDSKLVITNAKGYIDLTSKITLTNDKAMSYDAGSETSIENYQHTNMIKCSPGDKFKFLCCFAYNYAAFACYDNESNYISDMSIYDDYHNTSNYTKMTSEAEITIPEGVSFIVFNNCYKYYSNFYSKWVYTNISVKRYQTGVTDPQGAYDISATSNAYCEIKITELDKTTEKIKLLNKSIFVIGDSIAQGAGSGNYSYGEMLRDKYNMSLTKDAIGGTTLAVQTDKTNSICERVQAMTGSYDYILLEGGINDVFANISDGTYKSDYTVKFDTSTIAGALDTIFKFLAINYPDTKKAYVLVHHKEGQFSTKQTSAFEIIEKVCKKWGIAICDIYHNSGMLGTTNTKFANMNAFFNNSDGTHPTAEGYKKFYLPLIEAKLKEL